LRLRRRVRTGVLRHGPWPRATFGDFLSQELKYGFVASWKHFNHVVCRNRAVFWAWCLFKPMATPLTTDLGRLSSEISLQN
jgi:hypothetical protein